MDEVRALFDDLMDAVSDADTKDQALANTIRAQLGKAPVILALPTRDHEYQSNRVGAVQCALALNIHLSCLEAALASIRQDLDAKAWVTCGNTS